MSDALTLTPKQVALVDQYRYWDVDHRGWSDAIIEDFCVEMESVGVWTDRPCVQFNGFGNQGDGASFTGDLDMATFMNVPAHDIRRLFPGVCRVIGDDGDGGAYELERRGGGRYCHSSSVYGVATLEEECPWEDDVRQAMWDTWLSLADVEFQAFEEHVQSICRGYMDQLYRRLEEQYDYLTSDEAVWESLVANERENETPEGWDEEDALVA